MRRRIYLAAAVLACLCLIDTTATAGVPLPPRAIIHGAACPDVGGACAQPATDEVWVPRGADQFALMHELGHLFDAEMLTDGDRAWFARQLRLPGRWNRGTGEYGMRSPSERFADAYAMCALNIRIGGLRRHRVVTGRVEGAYGYNPTRRQHGRICGAIRFVGRRDATARPA